MEIRLWSIIKNSVYLGTHYDANNEITAGSNLILTITNGKMQCLPDPPGGSCKKLFFHPLKSIKKLILKKIYPTKNGKWIVDMGENFTGTYSIKLSGQSGDKITFRFGERIYTDGTLNPMTSVTVKSKKWTWRAGCSRCGLANRQLHHG